jgi:DNA-binding NarL/FixJ family response regulator
MARSEDQESLDLSEEIARLIALLIRLQLPSQTEAILELSRLGFGTTRVAQLLGTTPNTVNVTVQKAKKIRK